MKFRGDSSVKVFPDMDIEELCSVFKTAYKAAGAVRNSYYDLPIKETAITEEKKEDHGRMIEKFRDTIFQEDCQEDRKLLYLELFADREVHRVLSSYGTDVVYERNYYWGELAANCRNPKDVEVFKEFSYDSYDENAICEMVRNVLDMSVVRAGTTEETPSGRWNVIFTDSYAHELLKMFQVRSDAEKIVAGISNYQIGMQIVPENFSGAELNLSLNPETPYSDEGVSLKRFPIIREGRVVGLHGKSRFASEKNMSVVGSCRGIFCESGSYTLESMKKDSYIQPVLFSDFIMYGSTGDYFGEIRLAYYFDGKQLRTIQGGSISGNLNDEINSMKLSRERYREKDYDGPKAILLEHVLTAGK